MVVWRAVLYQKEALRQISGAFLHAKLKSIKIAFSLTDKLCNSTINDLIVKQEFPAIATKVKAGIATNLTIN